MKKLIIATTLTASIISMPAMAWGDREQGALAGIVGTLMFQHVTKPHNNAQSYGSVHYSEQPRIEYHYETRRYERYCDSACQAYEAGLRERMRYEEERRAYNCGRYGRCN